MKNLILLCCLLFAATATAQVEWLTWEEAVARNQKEPKKLLVDLYTDWCGWCKKMDRDVFADPMIAKYINANFYAVKFNAEQREAVKYDKVTFKFDPNIGRRGAHELAYTLLDGRLSFPTVVYLDDQMSRITVSPGFKPAAKYINELNFIGGEHYKKTTYKDYISKLGK